MRNQKQCEGCGDFYPIDMIVEGTRKCFCAHCLGFDPDDATEMEKMNSLTEEEVDKVFWEQFGE